MDVQTNLRFGSVLAFSTIITRILEWQLMASLVCIIAVPSLIELVLVVRRRQALFEVFKRGNIPVLKNENPILGNIVPIFRGNDCGKLLLDHHKTLGKTFGCTFGPEPYAVTTDLDLIQQLWITDHNKHPNTPDLRQPDVTIVTESMFQLKDDTWRKVRHALDPTITHHQMQMHHVVKDIDESCRKFLDCLKEHPLKSNGRLVEVLRLFEAFCLDVNFSIPLDLKDLITMKWNHKDELVELAISGVKTYANPASLLAMAFSWTQGPLGYLSKFTEFGTFVKHISAAFDKSMKDRKQVLEQQGSGSGDSRIIDTMIKWENDDKMKNLNINALLFFICMAGFENVANNLAILFWLLAKHQNIQDELREAIVLEGEKTPYLGWALKESLRLYPATPVTGRTLNEDVTTSSGQKLFKGSSVVANICAIQRSREYWGDDVDEFRPNRFSEPLKHPCQFLAFSSGPRNCFGKHLADVQSRAIVSKLLLKYRIEPCASTPEEIIWKAPNVIHIIIQHPIELKFVELIR